MGLGHDLEGRSDVLLILMDDPQVPLQLLQGPDPGGTLRTMLETGCRVSTTIFMSPTVAEDPAMGPGVHVLDLVGHEALAAAGDLELGRLKEGLDHVPEL